MRSAERMPVVATAAGFESEPSHRNTPEWAVAMAVEWSAAKKRYPRASLASISGLPPDRVAKLVDGNAIPRPSEALALDHALGCDASRLLPPRRPFEQRVVDGERTDRAPVRRTHALTGPRQQRVDAWAAQVAASGLTLAAIAEAAGIGPQRTLRLLRQGAVATPDEMRRLVDVLGEPSTAKSDGGFPPAVVRGVEHPDSRSVVTRFGVTPGLGRTAAG